jgi:hypothetical protein
VIETSQRLRLETHSIQEFRLSTKGLMTELHDEPELELPVHHETDLTRAALSEFLEAAIGSAVKAVLSRGGKRSTGPALQCDRQWRFIGQSASRFRCISGKPKEHAREIW